MRHGPKDPIVSKESGSVLGMVIVYGPLLDNLVICVTLTIFKITLFMIINKIVRVLSTPMFSIKLGIPSGIKSSTPY